MGYSSDQQQGGGGRSCRGTRSARHDERAELSKPGHFHPRGRTSTVQTVATDAPEKYSDVTMMSARLLLRASTNGSRSSMSHWYTERQPPVVSRRLRASFDATLLA
jgi:hypothetical protein